VRTKEVFISHHKRGLTDELLREIRAGEMKPKRIQRKRTKGWKMPPNTVYVGRPTKWGNPYTMHSTPKLSREGRQAVVDNFRAIIWANQQGAERFRKPINELRGKDLACWCPLDQPCHADVLLELANV
jgi:hypothetical protein